MVKTCVTCNKDFSEQSESCPFCGGLLGLGSDEKNEIVSFDTKDSMKEYKNGEKPKGKKL
jgi:rRNA maturation endonuclease Nob1